MGISATGCAKIQYLEREDKMIKTWNASEKAKAIHIEMGIKELLASICIRDNKFTEAEAYARQARALGVEFWQNIYGEMETTLYNCGPFRYDQITGLVYSREENPV